jgi:hypothetical protein
MKTNENIVKVGQIWADKDKRREGRQLRVEQIGEGFALCSKRRSSSDQFGQRLTRIKLDRFSRYRLVDDAPKTEHGEGTVAGLNKEGLYTPPKAA